MKLPGFATGTVFLMIVAGPSFLFATATASTPVLARKAHFALEDRLSEVGPDGRIKSWVLFRKNKGLESPDKLAASLARVARSYEPRAIERRLRLRTRPGLFDVDDLALPEDWLDGVRSTGAEIIVTSRWVHAASVLASRDQLERIAALPYVRELRPVLRGRRSPLPTTDPGAPPVAAPTGGTFYGEAEDQLKQVNLLALHAMGFTGAGVRIGVLDTGFRRSHAAFNDPSHPIQVVAEWDFVDDDPATSPEPGDLADQHEHGTLILGTMAAYQPGVLVGAAYDAEYILAKVEDVAAEYLAEEDLFVAGVEFIEANGGDIATSSVVIFDHYTQDQLNGLTSIMTQGLNVAAANGLHVCQGIGNNGHDSDPQTSTMVPPSDAFKTITVGSVDSTGVNATFTSDGPTADGRVKPEVMARGVDTRTVDAFDDVALTGADGASLATPLVAGASACLLQAHPDWTVDQLRSHLLLRADYYRNNDDPDPLFIRGFGLVDVLLTLSGDCNVNGMDDTLDLADGTSGDCNANLVPDECDIDARTSDDDLADSLPDECTECAAGPGCPAEVEMLMVSRESHDVVLSWQSSPTAAAYSLRRDVTPQSAGTTAVGQVPDTELSWADPGAVAAPPDLAFYMVRGLSAGGVAGP